jgi:hypothetical protein
VIWIDATLGFNNQIPAVTERSEHASSLPDLQRRPCVQLKVFGLTETTPGEPAREYAWNIRRTPIEGNAPEQNVAEARFMRISKSRRQSHSARGRETALGSLNQAIEEAPSFKLTKPNAKYVLRDAKGGT